MAYIRSCEVKGLAARITREISLNRDINVFFGGNGSGKTSLLKVLHSALDNDLSELKRVALKGATINIGDVVLEDDRPWYEPTTLIRSTPDEYPLFPEKIESGFIIGSRRQRVRDTRWISTADRNGTNLALRHIFLPISRLYFYEDKNRTSEPAFGYREPLTEADFDKNFVETVNLLWLRYTRNVGIEVQIAQANGIREILYDFLIPDSKFQEGLDQHPISNPKLAYERLITFLDRQSRFDRELLDESAFTERMQNDPRMRKVVQDVERVEELVEFIRTPRNELERILRQMISGGKEIKLQDKDIHAFGKENETISLEDLSSGEKQLLRIFIDVLVADGQPIIIDEPELSLHIDWQRRFLGVLRKLAPTSQIIVATHSPEIMAEISDEKIIEL